MDAIYFVEIGIIFYVILRLVGVNMVDLLINTVIRCLSGGIFLCVVNFILSGMGKNFFVTINEISFSVTAVFGISGAFFLTIFQYYLTK